MSVPADKQTADPQSALKESGSQNFSIALDLFLYGLMLIGFVVFARHRAPNIGEITLVSILAGGGLTVVLGALGLVGSKMGIGAKLTLLALSILLLPPTVSAWFDFGPGDHSARLAAVFLSLLLGFGVGQLGNFPTSLRRSHSDPRKGSGRAPASHLQNRHAPDK